MTPDKVKARAEELAYLDGSCVECFVEAYCLGHTEARKEAEELAKDLKEVSSWIRQNVRHDELCGINFDEDGHEFCSCMLADTLNTLARTIRKLRGE